MINLFLQFEINDLEIIQQNRKLFTAITDVYFFYIFNTRKLSGYQSALIGKAHKGRIN